MGLGFKYKTDGAKTCSGCEKLGERRDGAGSLIEYYCEEDNCTISESKVTPAGCCLGACRPSEDALHMMRL